jgi:dTDP-4-amino-4,6-dideoxygalactose transaminase
MYKGRPAGSMAPVSFFSFRSGKYLSAGEGSVIRCNDPALAPAIAAEVASYPQWDAGRSTAHSIATYVKSSLYRRPWYGILGYPLGRRIDARFNLSAKSGFVKRRISPGDFSTIKRRLPDFHLKIARQRAIAQSYLATIKADGIVLPRERNGCTSNYFQFAVRTASEQRRDGLAAFLSARAVDTAKYLSDVVDDARLRFGYAGDCPETEQCVKSILSIPNYYTLTDNDSAYIADCINRYTARLG